MGLVLIFITALIWGFACYKLAEIMTGECPDAGLNPTISAIIGFIFGLKGAIALLVYAGVRMFIIKRK